MKKPLLAASVAAFTFTAPASATDAERQLGLIVSGVVDSWAGVQIINNDGFQIIAAGDDDIVFANGGEGLLSLPLGDNLSIQSDVKYEYNSNALEDPDDNGVFGPRYSFQGAVHLSWRDPTRGLFGVFGGAGTTDFFGFRSDVAFVGGEAQLYLDNITLYAQGGYVDFDDRNFGFPFLSLSDGLFARGVFRWFMTDDSRIQIEGTYVNADHSDSDDFFDSFGTMEAFSFSVRYDFTLAGLPVIEDTPLYIGYRGTFRENCVNISTTGSAGIDDHTIMIGTSFSFSGDRLTVDRQGATLDTPDFSYGCVAVTGAD